MVNALNSARIGWLFIDLLFLSRKSSSCFDATKKGPLTTSRAGQGLFPAHILIWLQGTLDDNDQVLSVIILAK